MEIVLLFPIKRKSGRRSVLVGYRCMHAPLNTEPEPDELLLLCKNCKAAEAAGADFRIPARAKYKDREIEMYQRIGERGRFARVLGGFGERDTEWREYPTKKAALAHAMKLIEDREREALAAPALDA